MKMNDADIAALSERMVILASAVRSTGGPRARPVRTNPAHIRPDTTIV